MKIAYHIFLIQNRVEALQTVRTITLKMTVSLPDFDKKFKKVFNRNPPSMVIPQIVTSI